MPHFQHLPIMPKESKAPVSGYIPAVPYPTSANSSAARNAAVWRAADDEILLQARASGLNWGPISAKHFPGKTPNACRKRHERLLEKRQGEDWDTVKLDLLAQEYAAVRKEMWEVLAARLGEKWTLVESKCMEKGLKTLLATARQAQRRYSATQEDIDQGIPTDQHSDSGIGIGSDAEMDVDEPLPSREHAKQVTWPGTQAEHPAQKHPYHQTLRQSHHQDHVRSRSLPQPLPPMLPLYQPPPPLVNAGNMRRAHDVEVAMTMSPATMSFVRHSAEAERRYSPEGGSGRGGMSIQSVLSPAPQCA